MSNEKQNLKPAHSKPLIIADVSSSGICLCDFSDRYWDKNGSRCIKCGKVFLPDC